MYVDPSGLRTQWHHLLPRHFRDTFQSLGFDIDSAEFGWTIDSSDHVGGGGLHPDWNKGWDCFLNSNKGNLTTSTVRDQLARMKDQFEDVHRRGKPAPIGQGKL